MSKDKKYDDNEENTKLNTTVEYTEYTRINSLINPRNNNPNYILKSIDQYPKILHNKYFL